MKMSKRRMKTRWQLAQVERDLNGIIAAISQVSSGRSRHARRVAQMATGKLVGVASVGGMLMCISAFGAASTGTAIGALSGAAATSAQMYWIGSVFGLGAVAGAIILPVIGAVLGVAAVLVLSRALFGRLRKVERMQEFEVRSLFACLQMANAATETLSDARAAPSGAELRVFASEGLLPLCALIEDNMTSPKGEGEAECNSFEDVLALLPRRKLKRHHRRLSRRATKLARMTRGGGIRGLLRL